MLKKKGIITVSMWNFLDAILNIRKNTYKTHGKNNDTPLY